MIRWSITKPITNAMALIDYHSWLTSCNARLSTARLTRTLNSEQAKLSPCVSWSESAERPRPSNACLACAAVNTPCSRTQKKEIMGWMGNKNSQSEDEGNCRV